MLGKKKNDKKIKPGRLKSLTVDGKPVKALHIHVFMEGESAIFRITTPAECEDLHFDTIDFVAAADDKKIKITGSFKSANQEKGFVIYDFVIEKYNEFFG